MGKRWDIYELEGDRKCLKGFCRGLENKQIRGQRGCQKKGASHVLGDQGWIVDTHCRAGELPSSSAQLPGARTESE